MDMLPTIIAKSDQINAEDLLGGARTITILAVKGSDNPDQPVSIHYEGDDRKPYKPCKTCRRILVHCWGPDASQYVGRQLTIFCDPTVVYGGIKVGGIRISHMSHINREVVIALMVTRGKRAPYKVLPLRLPTPEAMDADFYDRAPDSESLVGPKPEIGSRENPHDPLMVPLHDLTPDERVAWVESFKAKCIYVSRGTTVPALALMESWRLYFDRQIKPLYEIDRALYDSLETWFDGRMKKARAAEQKPLAT